MQSWVQKLVQMTCAVTVVGSLRDYHSKQNTPCAVLCSAIDDACIAGLRAESFSRSFGRMVAPAILRYEHALINHTAAIGSA